MGLSPEENRRVYEEEKARIEAQKKMKSEKQGTEDSTSTGLKPTTAALLCYVGIWVSGIIFFLIEEKNNFVRFHAAQSIVAFGTLTVAGIILGWIPMVGGAFSTIIGVIGFIVWIVMIVKASNGQRYKLPWAGDVAEKMIAKSAGTGKEDIETREKDEHSEPPSAETPPAKPSSASMASLGKQIGAKVEGYFENTRNERVASSGAVIAWSIVLLIFFNFFSQYIAYYHNGAREPILTSDFNLWLPILTTTLVLSIIGHIILIILDKYLLREIIIIVLNCFGIAVVLTLLNLFPFDFSVIPNANIAAYTELGVRIALIATTVGLGIGTLVRFIKLVVNITKVRD